MTVSQRPTGHDPSGENVLEWANAELDACDRLVKAANAAHRPLTKSEKDRIEKAISAKDDALETVRLARELNEMRGPVFAYGEGGGGSFAGSFSKAILDRSLTYEASGRSPHTVLGVNTVSAALGLKAPTVPSAEEFQLGSGAVTTDGFDKRFMYRTLPMRQVEPGQSAIDDFRISDRTLSGTVQRALDAVSAKATLDHTYDQVITELAQFAVVIPSIPNALLEVGRASGSVRDILDGEGRQEVENGIDAAAFAAVSAAAGSGGFGADIVARIRVGIADLRDAGYEPDVLVVNSLDAADLDLFEKSVGAGYQFAVRRSNDSDPLFGLRIVESKAATGAEPLLYDSRRLGVQYLGTVAAAVDPYAGADGSNFVKNLSDLRFEVTAKTVIRDAAAAIFLDASS